METALRYATGFFTGRAHMTAHADHTSHAPRSEAVAALPAAAPAAAGVVGPPALLYASPFEAKPAPPPTTELQKPFSGVYAEDPRWIDSLSTTQYVGLVVAAMVGPFVTAVGLSRAIRSYQIRKYGKQCAANARQFLERLPLLKPKYVGRVMPSLPPEEAKIATRLPFKHKYVYLNDPQRFPAGIPAVGWQNTDVAVAKAGLERVGKMTNLELRWFNVLYTQWVHAPVQNEQVRATMRWIAFGTVDPAFYVKGHLPKAAIDDIPPEQQEEARAKYVSAIETDSLMMFEMDPEGFHDNAAEYLAFFDEAVARAKGKTEHEAREALMGNFPAGERPDGTFDERAARAAQKAKELNDHLMTFDERMEKMRREAANHGFTPEEVDKLVPREPFMDPAQARAELAADPEWVERKKKEIETPDFAKPPVPGHVPVWRGRKVGQIQVGSAGGGAAAGKQQIPSAAGAPAATAAAGGAPAGAGQSAGGSP